MIEAVIEEQVTTNDGASLWTATSGIGPPLALCHGGPGLWDDQAPVASMVDDLVTVHRWDQRGGGRSTNSGPYAVSRFVADLEMLRKHFGHDRWIVGGHSWGATLALRYAFTYPDHVVALLYLCGTGVGNSWKPTYHAERERRLTSEQSQRLRELKIRKRSYDEEREYRTLSWAPDYGDRGRALEFAAREAAVESSINYECNETLNTETDAENEEDLLYRCQNLDLPVLIVSGAKDPRPAWALDSMVEALPQVEFRVLPNVGHMPWVEDPDRLATILRKFLKHVIKTGYRKEKDG